MTADLPIGPALVAALRFASPGTAVAAAIAAVIVAMLARRGLSAARRGASWTAALARAVAVACAGLAAAGPEMRWTAAEPGASAVAASDRTTLRDDVRDDGAIVVRWPRDAADPGAAVAAARASLPADRPSSLTLTWSSADSAAGADGALRAGARMVAAVAPPNDSEGIALAGGGPGEASVVLPSRVDAGVPFRVVLDAGESDLPAGPATVTVNVTTIAVDIPSRARRVATNRVEVPAGDYLVRVSFADGTNAVRRVTVAPPPTILVATIDGTEPPLARRLRQQGFPVTVVSAASADLADPADVTVLGPGVSGRAAGAAAEALLAGRGVLVAGGAGRNGLWRFRGTALESLLPVVPANADDASADDAPPADRPPPDAPPSNVADTPGDAVKPVAEETDRRAHRIALVLCVDRSGSMSSGDKLLMACESALAAARTLSPDDRVGVVAFDVLPRWIVPMQPAADLVTLRRRLAALSADGGTAFLPALREAFQAARGEDAAIRHVIFLTDGQGESALFRDVIEQASSDGITMSAIAVGDDADIQVLGRMAGWGRGRVYPAVDPMRLPQVVTADTARFAVAPRDGRRRAEVGDAPPLPAPPRPDAPAAPDPRDGDRDPVAGRVPRLAFETAALAGFAAAEWPEWPHPETVALRPGAAAPLVWDDGTPALAVGRAGRGRIAVAAADVVSSDGAALFAWHEQPRFAAQLVRSLAEPPVQPERTRVDVLRRTDGSALVAVSGRAGALPHTSLTAEDARTPLVPTGDLSIGRMSEFRDPRIHGALRTDSGGEENFQATPREARPVPHAITAAATAALSGASVAAAPLLAPPGRPEERRRPAALWLLALGASVLLVEAAARRGSSA